MFSSLGEYVKGKEYHEKALAIRIEIDDRAGEATDLANLGILSRSFGDFNVAEEYLEKALFISRDIGYSSREFNILLDLALLSLLQNKLQDAFMFLYQCIEIFEELRNFLGVNDQFKISFLEKSGAFPYEVLGKLLSDNGNPSDALYVEELRRARGLADLMASQYFVKTHISANPQSWVGLDNIMRKENKSACLYISYFQNHVYLWFL